MYRFVKSIDFVFVVLIVLLPFVIFNQAVFSNKLIAVGDFTGSDLLDLHLPFKYLLHDSYTQGKIPLWTNYLANGFPVLAEGQSGVFYPINIILSFFDPVAALNYSIIFAFIIAGLGTYFYCLTIPRMTRWGAFLAACSFMFSSFFVARVKHLNLIVVGAYLPWILFCTRMFFSSKKYIWVLLLSIVFSLQIFAGHPHMFYLCLLIFGWHVLFECVYVFVCNYRSETKRDTFRVVSNYFVTICVALVLSLGLSAVQILPTLELTWLSERTEYTYLSSIAFPLHPFYLGSFIYPYLLGNPALGTYKVDMGRFGIWWENVMYIGTLQFIIACAFVFAIVRNLRKAYLNHSEKFEFLRTLSFEKHYLLFIGVSILFFLSLAMGTYSISYIFIYYLVPGMRLFRFPNRFNIYVLLGMSIFFGMAVSVYLPIVKRKLRKYNYLFYSAMVVFLVSLFYPLYWFSSNYISYYPAKEFLKEPKALDLFRGSSGKSRVYSITQHFDGPYSELGWMNDKQEVFSLEEAIPNNHTLRYGIDSFTDRGWYEGGLGTREHFEVERAILSSPVFNLDDRQKLLSLWNVGYILTNSPLDVNKYLLKEGIPSSSNLTKPIYIYENPDALPRAYIARSLQSISDKKQLLEKSNEAEFNPYLTAYTLRPGFEVANGLNKSFESNKVVMDVYSSTFVKMSVQNSDGGYLIFSDTFYPGWNAYVDGVRTEIIPAYLSQRAIKMPVGRHSVEWKYQPKSFYIGVIVSSVSFVFFIVILVYTVFWKKRIYEDKL